MPLIYDQIKHFIARFIYKGWMKPLIFVQLCDAFSKLLKSILFFSINKNLDERHISDKKIYVYMYPEMIKTENTSLRA